MIQSQYPATWGSFRLFEQTRQVYNCLSKLGVLSELKTFMSDHCDFLNSELSHDSVIFTMKEILSTLPNVFNIMAEQEKQALTLEAMHLCDAWWVHLVNICYHRCRCRCPINVFGLSASEVDHWAKSFPM